MDAALEEGRLPAAIGLVDLGQADIARAPVIAGEDHHRVLVEAELLQLLQQTPDIAVEVAHHRAIDSQAVILDLRQGVVVGLGRLQGRVDGVGREVHEEGPVAVRLHRLQRLVRQIVGHVALGREHLRAVELDHVGQVRPEEAVDRVPRLLGVHHARIALGQVHRAARHEAETFVKALVLRPRALGGAEVPLAEVHRVVALVLQHLGDEGLGQGHAQGVHLGRVLDLSGVEGRPDQSARLLRRADKSLEGHGRWSELKAETGGVAAGHDRGAGRGAGGVAVIAVGEADALLAQRVDVRCRDSPAGDPAAVEGDVVEAHVVGEDDDDVRRTLPRGGLCRPLRPGHRPVRRNVRQAVVGDHKEDRLPVRIGEARERRDGHHDPAQNCRPPLHDIPLPN